MKRKLIALSERYAKALRKHLREGLRASLQPALGLGRQAVALGLETLELARMHERAFATLGPSNGKHRLTEQAENFFTQAITPLVETHRAALKAATQLKQVNKSLDQRTMNLTAANRSLRRGIAQRKIAEKALRKSGGDSEKLLKESHRLQKHLRNLTHRIMATQENKRKQVSHELQDEIAQTLLGINVRLLTLKDAAAVNAKGFKKDIASTQRLVKESIRSINRFARDLDPGQQP